MSNLDPGLDPPHLEFLSNRRAMEEGLISRGYTFVGNIIPPRVSRRGYEEQEREIAERAGVESLEIIGDVMSTYDSDPTVRELMVMFDYAAAYAPPKS